MLFSVLMTVYKGDDASFFKEALDSVSIKQILAPAEIVLVCDGPLTEELNAVVSEFEEIIEYLNIVRLERNVGQGKALNKGIEACKHEYIARMDSDDISLPERFLEQMGFVQKHPEVDVLSSVIEEFDSKGMSNLRTLPIEHVDILRLMKFRAPVNHGCCVYKKSVVQSVGGYSGLYQCQDYILWIDLAASNYIFHNLTLCHMRVRMLDGYGRKVGLSYAKEELAVQQLLHKVKLINRFEYCRNLIVKGFGRLLPSALVSYVYVKFYR